MWIVIVYDQNGTQRRFYQSDNRFDARCWANHNTNIWYETYTIYRVTPVEFSE